MKRTFYAPAKINLWLRVFTGDESGYHPLDTLFCAIDLQDTLEIAEAEAIQLTVTGADVGPLESNLAYRAAQEYFRALGRPPRVAIHLHKVIPAGAGLGGGSSDAAAVLRALQQLHESALPAPDLLALAARLGSDVPFFLCGSSCARARGRGELLEPVPPLSRRPVVVIAPDFPIATRAAYRWLDESGTLSPPAEPWAAPRSWSDVEARAGNSFEPVLFERYPVLQQLRDELRAGGARIALVSGSGSALFGVFADHATAEAAHRKLAARSNIACYLAHTLASRTDWTEAGMSS